ncbi:GNAT family N-acetyltransferase [Aequorivita marina]|uniref:GNAT family N-acetyltransferase n=1 Tax=Aequorivita marina TaxID=3073654 RepID=UPI002875786D|nr:GNAT family N-acetyltransferase [Aequorivita sp. S2608]MDS1298296.1 GNAT family N-acetyltransferase [Aequorivita sp. S2608]
MNVIDNKEESRFETKVDGHDAFIEYSMLPGVLSLNHTEVDKALSGQGVASEMTEKTLMQIEQRGLKVIPECGFIKNYIDKHPEWKSILADDQKKKPSQD